MLMLYCSVFGRVGGVMGAAVGAIISRRPGVELCAVLGKVGGVIGAAGPRGLGVGNCCNSSSSQALVG